MTTSVTQLWPTPSWIASFTTGAHGVQVSRDRPLAPLRRRSQKDDATWERVAELANDYLPKPRNLIHGRASASPSVTQGRSHVRESGPRGSVRGVQ